MGNLINKDTKESEILSNSKFNVKDVQELKKTLGTVGRHFYANHPTDISDDFLHENIDEGLLYSSPENSELFNTFLGKIHENIMGEYMKDNWPENAFLEEVSGCNHKESLMRAIEDIENITLPFTLEEGLTLSGLYRGYCIYEFPENTVLSAVNMKSVGINSCFVGSKNGKLVLVSPSQEPDTTPFIKMSMTCYVLSDQSCRISLDSVEGILYEEKEISLVNDGSHFQNLDRAFESYEANNSREMTLHLNKFRTWMTDVEKNGEVMSYVGGDVTGEILSLGDFMDRLQIS